MNAPNHYNSPKTPTKTKTFQTIWGEEGGGAVWTHSLESFGFFGVLGKL